MYYKNRTFIKVRTLAKFDVLESKFDMQELAVMSHALAEAQRTDYVAEDEETEAALRVLEDAKERIAETGGDHYSSLALSELDELIRKLKNHISAQSPLKNEAAP